MQAYFVILPYLTLAIANPCDVLKPVYKSFECKPGCINRTSGTKYDCRQSPYVTQYAKDRCYFKESFYPNGISLPKEYPGLSDSEMCRYTCDTTSISEGPFFDPYDCKTATLGPEYADKCIHDLLYNIAYFNKHRAPVFVEGRCPIEWIGTVPPGLVSDDSCTANPQNCCQFGTMYFNVNTEFQVSNRINCKCACPPLIECLEN